MDELHAVDQHEAVGPYSPELLEPLGFTGQTAQEAMSLAPGLLSILGEIAASDVKDRLHVQVSLRFPQLTEGDPFGMSQEPGCLMIQ